MYMVHIHVVASWILSLFSI